MSPSGPPWKHLPPVFSPGILRHIGPICLPRRSIDRYSYELAAPFLCIHACVRNIIRGCGLVSTDACAYHVHGLWYCAIGRTTSCLKNGNEYQQSELKKETHRDRPSMERQFPPWMLPTDDGLGTICSLCQKHSRRPRKSCRKSRLDDVPCQSITRQALVKHSQSESHVEAVKMEATLHSSRGDSGIRMAFERVASAERTAMLGTLKCMYFLNKREILHTTNFVPLCEFGKSLGALYLEDLRESGNAHYTSERFKQELVQALAETIAKPIQEHLCASPFFHCVSTRLQMCP